MAGKLNETTILSGFEREPDREAAPRAWNRVRDMPALPIPLARSSSAEPHARMSTWSHAPTSLTRLSVCMLHCHLNRVLSFGAPPPPPGLNSFPLQHSMAVDEAPEVVKGSQPAYKTGMLRDNAKPAPQNKQVRWRRCDVDVVTPLALLPPPPPPASWDMGSRDACAVC